MSQPGFPCRHPSTEFHHFFRGVGESAANTVGCLPNRFKRGRLSWYIFCLCKVNALWQFRLIFKEKNTWAQSSMCVWGIPALKRLCGDTVLGTFRAPLLPQSLFCSSLCCVVLLLLLGAWLYLHSEHLSKSATVWVDQALLSRLKIQQAGLQLTGCVHHSKQVFLHFLLGILWRVRRNPVWNVILYLRANLWEKVSWLESRMRPPIPVSLCFPEHLPHCFRVKKSFL